MQVESASRDPWKTHPPVYSSPSVPRHAPGARPFLLGPFPPHRIPPHRRRRRPFRQAPDVPAALCYRQPTELTSDAQQTRAVLRALQWVHEIKHDG
jgi:hypothetical protein